MNEWKPISLDSSVPKERPFLLSDEHGYVYQGETAFDFYDAKYWHAMPKYPFPNQAIMHDGWAEAVMKSKEMIEVAL